MAWWDNPWHQPCNTYTQQLVPFFKRWQLASTMSVEDQVIDTLLQTATCDLDDLIRRCSPLTWNQAFLAIDRLSRGGEIMLVPKRRGTYTVTVPAAGAVGPININSHPNHKEVRSCLR